MNTINSSPNSPYSDSYQPHLLLMKIVLIIFIAFELSCSGTTSSANSQESDHTRAIFVFGDSLVDVGNNNYVPLTIGKCDYFPYGIDFPGSISPTGRFTNGRTVVDIIGEELGLEYYIPPYLAPTTVGDVVLRGVNYASGGAGILNDTGAFLGGRISMDAQLDNFADTRNYIISNADVGGSLTSPNTFSKTLLQRALYIVVMGSNDFIGNYFSPVPSVSAPKPASLEMFVESLISRFREQLTRLYDMDARKIAVANVGPVGCTPLERTLNPLYATGDSCISFVNNAAILFNKKLKSLLMELNSNLVESKFVYADVYSILSHLIDNYQSYGFENYDSPCCKILAGAIQDLLPCSPTSILCGDRSKYVFWDMAHPTDATNVILAKRLLNDDSKDISPMNIRQLYYA
ncbi:hypothetical protein MKW94_020245 [Papaver nudicaule]|uniref:GDSL esterase/lipase n=1 Tax=Papaver nudicaule TaxID=74823 RepID=A0AA41SLC6_PAPNU|nr:hypothetical protein [Papaver nudicaule]